MALFDHLVGDREYARRDGETECGFGLEVWRSVRMRLDVSRVRHNYFRRFDCRRVPLHLASPGQSDVAICAAQGQER